MEIFIWSAAPVKFAQIYGPVHHHPPHLQRHPRSEDVRTYEMTCAGKKENARAKTEVSNFVSFEYIHEKERCMSASHARERFMSAWRTRL